MGVFDLRRGTGSQPKGEETKKSSAVASSDTIRTEQRVITRNIYHWSGAHFYVNTGGTRTLAGVCRVCARGRCTDRGFGTGNLCEPGINTCPAAERLSRYLPAIGSGTRLNGVREWGGLLCLAPRSPRRRTNTCCYLHHTWLNFLIIRFAESFYPFKCSSHDGRRRRHDVTSVVPRTDLPRPGGFALRGAFFTTPGSHHWGKWSLQPRMSAVVLREKVRPLFKRACVRFISDRSNQPRPPPPWDPFKTPITPSMWY